MFEGEDLICTIFVCALTFDLCTCTLSYGQNPQDGYNQLKRVIMIGDHHQVGGVSYMYMYLYVHTCMLDVHVCW